MKLSEADANLFYEIWFSLLDYINQKYKVEPSLRKIAGAKHLDPRQVSNVSDVLMEHLEDIDKYVNDKQDVLSEEEKEILISWKRSLKGTFILERHLKSGSIFIGEQNQVYCVQGIVSPYEEIIPKYALPLYVNTVLMPFKGKIITNGLLRSYPVSFGGGIKRMIKDTYMEAKKAGLILKSL